MLKRILLFFICASLLPVYTAAYSPVWSFHRGYLEKSGASLLHSLEVNLPQCSVGNICEQNAPFSIHIASAAPANAHTYSFFADGSDVTTLFYYDAAGDIFKVKPHYEQAFFANFRSSRGLFRYASADGASGELALLIANKTLKGRLRFADGGTPSNLAGLKAVLSYTGSDTVPPHTITALIDENGEYEVKPLAFLDYDISLDLPSKIIANSGEDDGVLTVTHFVPKFDFLLTLEQPVLGFHLLTPAALNPAVTGDIKSFTQLGGAPVPVQITRDKVALFFLRTDTDAPYSFLGETRGGVVFMLIVPPQKSEIYSYVYFSLFSSKGIYARVEMTGGALAPALKEPPLSVSLESPVKTDENAVKAHLYNSQGRAEDITHLFTFNEEAQTLTANKGYAAAIFEKLRRGAGTLSVTFCAEDKSDICFRVKREILPSGGVLRVKTALRPKKEKRFFITLSRLNFSETEHSRVLPLDSKGEALFEDLPEGEYQLLLSDLELTYHGEVFALVTREGNLSSRVKTLELPLKKMDKYTNYAPTGSVKELGILHLRREEYNAPDLKGLSPADAEVRVLGQPPAGFEYRISKDNITLLAPHFAKDARFALLFSAQGVVHKLNVFYEGYDLPQVKMEGQDFAMCPRERPYCGDAFIDIRGAKNGLYNGRFPLTLTFPEAMKGRDVRVSLEDKDITEMFDLSPTQGKIAVKRSAIPAFLSLLSEGRVLKMELSGEDSHLSDAVYYLDMTAAYKSAELSVVDELGGQSNLFAGLKVALIGSYGEGKKFFKTAVIKGERAAFEELPDGEYRAVLVDSKGNYAGEAGFTLSAGQNRSRLLFRVSCVSGTDEYMERCVPLIPIIAKNRLTAPEVGLIFMEDYGANFRSAEVTPEGALKARLLGRALVLFAAEAREPQEYRVTLKGLKRRVLIFDVDNASAEYIRAVTTPRGESGGLEVLGVDASFVYNGHAPLVFKFNTARLYDKDELRVTREEDSENQEFHKAARDITGMFIWDKHSLTLKEEEFQNFIELLDGGRSVFSVYMAEGDEARGYKFSVVISGAGADVTAELTGALTKNAQALLMGKREKNGYEYRQLVNVKGRTAVFKEVPKGIYEAVVFDLAEGALGSTELSVSGRESDLYLEVEIKRVGQ